MVKISKVINRIFIILFAIMFMYGEYEHVVRATAFIIFLKLSTTTER